MIAKGRTCAPCDHDAVTRPRRLLSALAGTVATALLAVGPVAAHGEVPYEPPGLGTLLLGWTFEPLVTVPLLFVAAAWLLLVRRVRRLHPGSPVSPWRTIAFLAGLAAIALALTSGIEAYDTTLFSVHMVQHLLLTFVAAPLLALAGPITQLLRAASPAVRRRWLLPILRSGPIAILAHPVVAWLAFTVVVWAAHFSPLFDLALESPAIHDLEHALFLGSALLFWWPVAGVDPAPHRMGHAARGLYLLLQMPTNSFLAVAILLATGPLYPHYATLGQPYGIDALADQQLAAGLMWVAADLVFIGAVLLVVASWMRREDREAPAAERRADRERARISERADELAARSGRPAHQSGSGEASSAR